MSVVVERSLNGAGPMSDYCRRLTKKHAVIFVKALGRADRVGRFVDDDVSLNARLRYPRLSVLQNGKGKTPSLPPLRVAARAIHNSDIIFHYETSARVCVPSFRARYADDN